MAQYIEKSALVAEIERRIKQFVKENNTLLKNSDNAKELRSRIIMCKEVLSFLDTIEVKEVEEITVSDKNIADVTVKKAIERKIINSPFALKGSYSGKMYFYSWKKSISKMPENIANLKLSTNYDFKKGELGSYNIEPMVRFVESSFDNRPFLEPYVLVWVSDYELAKKGE